jgi:GTP-binding protein YchF
MLMGFKTGIIGLPNVGKSTLFNALTKSKNAQAANFPFCTIDPNIGEVTVPDDRLLTLSKISESKETIPTKMTFIDIAGLVKGASKGEGLGNKFLANIRECDALAHVTRCFEDENVTHVNNTIDPVSDIEIINTELLLADLESVTKRIESFKKRIGKKNDEMVSLTFLEKVLDLLENGTPVRQGTFAEDELNMLNISQFLTSKPILFICNVDEKSISDGNEYSRRVEDLAKTLEAYTLNISVSIEQELSEISDEIELKEFLLEMGMNSTGLEKVIQTGYRLLGLCTYFTTGPKETRAWTIANSTVAPEAAGKIHTDFKKGFIRAETVSYSDFISTGGWLRAKELGKARSEGKDYVVKDGDIMNFLFSP